MEETAAPSALWLFVKALFITFVLYLVIGFALGLGMWFAYSLTKCEWMNPSRLFKFLQRSAEKLNGKKSDGQPDQKKE